MLISQNLNFISHNVRDCAGDNAVCACVRCLCTHRRVRYKQMIYVWMCLLWEVLSSYTNVMGWQEISSGIIINRFVLTTVTSSTNTKPVLAKENLHASYMDGAGMGL